MYQAPAVRFPVERSILAGWGLFVIWVMGVLSAACLGLNTAQASWTLAVALSISLVLGFFALIQWRKSPVGELRWDRRQWFFLAAKNGSSEPLVLSDVTVGLDFQSSLLVRCRTQWGEQQWFWLQSKTDKVAWRILRRAIFARPGNLASLESAATGSGKSAPQ